MGLLEMYIFMNMKHQRFILFLCVVSIACTTYAQSYVDIAKVSYGTVVNAGYEDDDAETNVNLFNVSLTVPIPVSEHTAIITGADFITQRLDLFPDQSTRSLAGLTFKAGLSLTHSERWSGTYIVLPKIASEDLSVDDDAFFIGGLALLKFQKNEHIQYRFGVYASQEAFGAIVTPIVGLYYKNEASYWEATVNFPINGDVNYAINDISKIGLAFEAPIRSYTIDTGASQNAYVQSDIIEIGPYFEHVFAKNILLRLHTGYTSIDYQVFADEDTLPFRLAAFEFSDDRNRLNSEMNGSFFVKASAVYRFDIPEKETID